MIVSSVTSFLKKLCARETCAHRFALACSIAVYIAFSPFVGLHTAMLIGAAWLLRLNMALLLSVGYLINNPFTMAPIVMSGYLSGHWLLHSYFEVGIGEIDPVWMGTLNSFLQSIVGIEKISFWAFMIGANVLGIVLALIAYPLMKRAFRLLPLMRKRAKGIV